MKPERLLLISALVCTILLISPAAAKGIENLDSLGNPENTPLDPSVSADYLIITSENLQSDNGEYAFRKLASKKGNSGLTARIENSEWIYREYGDIGEDRPAMIREFIRDAHELWGTQYVLLGGDEGIIPPRYLQAKRWSSSQGRVLVNRMPADMYYSCLEGSFDWDNDGKYGEPGNGPSGGEVDIDPEVYVGRAPVANSDEVSNFVRKTLAFQDHVPEGRSLVYLLGEYLGFEGSRTIHGGDQARLRRPRVHHGGIPWK